MVEILQLLHEISSFPEVLDKRSVLKNFSKFTNKHKKQSPGGVLSKEEDILKMFAKLTKKQLCRSLFFNRDAGWKPETVRRSYWRCSVKQDILKIFGNFHTKKPVLESLFNKVAVLGACNFNKEDSDTGASL